MQIFTIVLSLSMNSPYSTAPLKMLPRLSPLFSRDLPETNHTSPAVKNNRKTLVLNYQVPTGTIASPAKILVCGMCCLFHAGQGYLSKLATYKGYLSLPRCILESNVETEEEDLWEGSFCGGLGDANLEKKIPWRPWTNCSVLLCRA